MPTLSSEIRLGELYAQKIVLRHGLKWDDLASIEDLIEDSFCFQEKRDHLTFMGYAKSRYGKPYSLVLKSANRGEETWVATLHRTNDQQIKSKVQRAKAAGQFIRDLNYPFDE